jgi:hypothetical protein
MVEIMAKNKISSQTGKPKKMKLGADLTPEVVARWVKFLEMEKLAKGPTAEAALELFMILPLPIRKRAVNGDFGWLSLWLELAEREIKEIDEEADVKQRSSKKDGRKGSAS